MIATYIDDMIELRAIIRESAVFPVNNESPLLQGRARHILCKAIDRSCHDDAPIQINASV